ncbi:MAG: hypothetical protein NTZ34_08855 [Chloroflexi bacterium]|nr:hypothetical protein [Chloroflexota bacterium]
MASTSETAKNVKSSILQRLPRLSTPVWILIILCLFLIFMVPQVLGYMETASRQQALKLQISQLQSQYDALKAKMASQSSLAAKKAEAKAYSLPSRAGNPEISQVIMDLAWDNDITIITMGISSSNSKILDKDYPVLVYSLKLTGQVTNFQKFLLAIGKELPSSEYIDITITPATVEGELDKATMNIQVYCDN